MRHTRPVLWLLSVLILLTLTACRTAGGQDVTEVSTAPSQSVEATESPSQSIAQEEEGSVPPVASQQPASGGAHTPAPDSHTEKESGKGVASTPTPTEKPEPKPTPTPAPTPKPTPTAKTCYLTIECKTILGRMEDLTPGKESLIPADGVILKQTAVSFQEGETVFDVLCRATKEYGIHLEYAFTPGFGSYYIEGIHNLYEFDCGAGSGWMYYVNGVKPNYGASKYTLKEGDVIAWRYTCDLGYDL